MSEVLLYFEVHILGLQNTLVNFAASLSNGACHSCRGAQPSTNPHDNPKSINFTSQIHLFTLTDPPKRDGCLDEFEM